MPTRERAIRALIWSSVEQWGHYAVNLTALFFMVRLLQPEEFGLVAYAMVVIQLLQAVIEGGLLKAIIQREDLEPEHLDTAFWFKVALGLGLALLVQLTAEPLTRLLGEPRAEPLLRVLSILFLIQALTDIPGTILHRQMDFSGLALRAVLSALVGGIAGVGCALAGLGVWSLVVQMLATGVTGLIVLWVISDWRPGTRVSRRHLRQLYSYGLNVLGTHLLIFSTTRVDHLLIGRLLGPAELGIYVVGARAIELVLELTARSANLVALPFFSRMQDDVERVRAAYLHAISTSCAVAFPAFALLGATAPELIPSFFGDKWLDAIPVVQILAVAGAVQCLRTLWAPVIYAMGRPGWPLALHGLNLVLSTTAILLAIPWGITGVAVAVVMRSAVLVPIRLGILRRVIGVRAIQVIRTWLPPGVASLALTFVAGAVVVWLPGSGPLHVAMALAAGAPVYLLVLRWLAPGTVAEIREVAVSTLPPAVQSRLGGPSGGRG